MADNQQLNGLRVAILVTDDFEQVELTEPKKALDRAGAKTSIIAPKPGQVQGFNHDTKGDTFKVDMTLDQAQPNDFDAVLLPGGALNADNLRVEPKAQQFVQQANQAGKPIAVICHGGWLLVSAGLVKGRTMTSYHTIQDDIRNAGGQWQDQEVVRDRNWVSSRQPKDIPAFNQAMLALFGQPASPGQQLGQASQSATTAQTGLYTSESMVGTHTDTDATPVPANAHLKGPDEQLINTHQTQPGEQIPSQSQMGSNS